ncbi:MAG: malonic semialdehyde reductase [Hyphomicrobiaceae bacterium]|nr:malonic semialdehyde reductase [Hyphomicrobiaceae bacterium]
MSEKLAQTALNQLFFNARTHSKFLDMPVPQSLLRDLIDTLKMAPTAANSQPARFVFVTSQEGKALLRPHLSAGNRDKTMAAPVCVIIGQDMQFYERLPQLFPHTDARSWFAGKPEHIATTASRNSSLQGAYLILAARALGLDCGPMSGFDNAGVDHAFFAGSGVKSNFLCNLGFGDATALKPRSPRPSFEDLARFA